MKLFLHIGTEKTGSSFLQSYLANNRDILIENKIYFPSAGLHEAEMKKGFVTPGNAGDLDELLKAKSWNKIKKLLGNTIKLANYNKCEAILLSNELLVKRFSEENTLRDFLKLCDSLCMKCEEMLLIVREPIEQALSLYKHRSKNGNMLTIEQWLEKDYNLVNCLGKIYNVFEINRTTIKQFFYQKNSMYLVDICINKWLKLNLNINVPHRNINPSLTLSELSLLNQMHLKDKILSKIFFDFMIKIDPKEKSNDRPYQKYIISHINNYMTQYNSIWQLVYSNMNNKQEFIPYYMIAIDENNSTFNFSNEQLIVISEFSSYLYSYKYFIYKLKKKIKRMIIKITPDCFLKLRIKLLTQVLKNYKK